MLLTLALQVAVPLHIRELSARGGPTDTDLDWARQFAWRLGSEGDTLLYRGKRGEARDMFNSLARAIAVMAFAPGGIRLFEMHWEAFPEEARP